MEEHRLCKLIELNAMRHGCFPWSEGTGIELLSTLRRFLEGSAQNSRISDTRRPSMIRLIRARSR